MHTYLNAGYPHVFCVTLARETKVRGHEDKIDEPSVSTYPSWCADPCLEMVKSLPYLDFMSECFHPFDYHNPAPSSCQASKDSSSEQSQGGLTKNLKSRYIGNIPPLGSFVRCT